MHAARRPLLSEHDFLALPETSTKCELIDGEVVVSPAPSAQHQAVIRRIVRALERWSEVHAPSVMILFAPVDIRFQPNRILQPDIALWLSPFELPEDGPINVVPDVCIEVLSRDRLYDRVTKRMIYAAAGVKEYWVVERRGPIERWTGEALDLVDELDDRLVSQLLPGFEANVRDLCIS